MNAPSPTDTDRRTAILDAAVESFGKLGYYGTSLQRIATEVGLTKAGVLHYVGSKEGLLKLALTEEYDRVTESRSMPRWSPRSARSSRTCGVRWWR